MSSEKKWSNEFIKELVELKNSEEYEKRFGVVKGKARQIASVWDDLAKEIGQNINGTEARTQYNHLFNQFKKHKLIADRSGEGSVRWKHFNLFKETLNRVPAIEPMCVIDSANPVPILKNDEMKNTTGDESTYCNSINLPVKKKSVSIQNKETFEQKYLGFMENRNEVILKLLEDNGNSKKLEDRIDKIDLKVEEISENLKF